MALGKNAVVDGEVDFEDDALGHGQMHHIGLASSAFRTPIRYGAESGDLTTGG